MEKGVRVFLGLGSNIGDRQSLIESAVEQIDQLDQCAILAYSSLYETEPWGEINQPFFLNLVLKIRTTLAPLLLLQQLQQIEALLLREKSERWGPRTIDIDILLYGKETIRIPGLIIPHPRLTERRFVLEPLNEIAPKLSIPGQIKNVQELLSHCEDRGNVILFRPRG